MGKGARGSTRDRLLQPQALPRRVQRDPRAQRQRRVRIAVATGPAGQHGNAQRAEALAQQGWNAYWNCASSRAPERVKLPASTPLIDSNLPAAASCDSMRSTRGTASLTSSMNRMASRVSISWREPAWRRSAPGCRPPAGRWPCRASASSARHSPARRSRRPAPSGRRPWRRGRTRWVPRARSADPAPASGHGRSRSPHGAGWPDAAP